MKKIICFILLLALFSPVSGNTTKPAIYTKIKQKNSSPTQTAVYFLKQMEKFLAVEHKNTKQANTIKNQLVDMISNQNLKDVLARFGLKLSDIPAAKVAKAKHSYLNAWIASINFYTGHIQYNKIKLFRTTTAPSDSIFADMIVPVKKIDDTCPINIFVRCIRPRHQKNNWKVMLVMLVPKNIKKTKSKSSASKPTKPTHE